MDRQTLNTYLCAILTTLDEIGFAPETSAYLAIGCTFTEWQTVRQVLLAGGLATSEHHQLHITAKGREVAAKVTAHVNAHRKAA